MIPDVDLAYMAGVVDSDGFITIRRRYGGTMAEMVGVGQTGPEAVTMLHRAFGGVVKVQQRKAAWRPIHYWIATSRDAVAAVAALRPFLRIKARQADIVLALRDHKALGRSVRERTGVRALRLTDEAVAHRVDLWRQIRVLNDRRPSNVALGA